LRDEDQKFSNPAFDYAAAANSRVRARNFPMRLRLFLRDRTGQVAPLLALSMIPIIGSVTAAIDYNRANLARAAMQAALDSTALMLAKQAKELSEGPAGDVNTKANSYFKAMFSSTQAQDVEVNATLDNPQPGSYVLNVKGSARVPLKFTKVFGNNDIDISATAEAVWGIHKLNLALALDNTGSMASSGKMDALKTAAHNLLSTLQNAAHSPGDIKVSIVPFATDVNVGTDKVDADWIDWSNWEAANGTCNSSWYHSASSCSSHGYAWTPAAHSAWNGCVYDRDQSNDVGNAAAVASTPAVMYRAHQASNCPAAMIALSEDWTALNDRIDAMTPTGNTNVTIGLQLAWQTLTAADPFNAPAKATDLDRVIVVLTDGTNTENRWTSSSTSIDSRTQKVCENAKADNVKVYAVRVIDGNATLLKGCATKTSMYYDVEQASQLDAAFGSIAQNLANLRLTK
jgi:Mg-chelatase subunit ChlD